MAAAPLVLPINRVTDGKAQWRRGQLDYFWSSIWPEAVRDLGRCGIQVQATQTPGEVDRPSQRQPIITGLQHGALNLAITDQIPMYWDHGRALNGVTMMYRGYHLCMVALNWAHRHQLPVVSVNTCLHEILHALLHDIFETKPQGFAGQSREARVDACATRMWLFGDGSAVRGPAREYVAKLK